MLKRQFILGGLTKLLYLKNSIFKSDLKTKPEKELSKLCEQYDTIFQTILNEQSPLLTNTVSERPPTPWMTQ